MKRERESSTECSYSLLGRRAGDRQAVANLADTAVVLDELVLAVSQPPLGRILEGEVGVEFVVVGPANDLQPGVQRSLQRRVGSGSRTLICTS